MHAFIRRIDQELQGAQDALIAFEVWPERADASCLGAATPFRRAIRNLAREAARTVPASDRRDQFAGLRRLTLLAPITSSSAGMTSGLSAPESSLIEGR